ncbi:MAG: phosphatidate cytidylyltransferase [Acidipila sp.]|nr:phosphatidate cytidylyltransferase [Acidipila sp.]
MTRQRLLTAAILIPIVVGADLYGPTWLIAILVALITVLALREFFDISSRAGMVAYSRWCFVCAVALVFAQFLAAQETAVPYSNGTLLVVHSRAAYLPLSDLILVVFGLGLAVLVWASKGPSEGKLAAMAISTCGMLLVALPLSFIPRLHALEDIGPRILLFVLVTIWVGDSCAYFVGRWVGRLPMAPRLSPKKTWEGAAANLTGSLIVGFVAQRWLHFGLSHLLAMAALGNIAGQLGDLVESAYKRAAVVKDSSSLLPGHGGVLDRVDSLIFAAPVVWYYFSVIVERHL